MDAEMVRQRTGLFPRNMASMSETKDRDSTYRPHNKDTRRSSFFDAKSKLKAVLSTTRGLVGLGMSIKEKKEEAASRARVAALRSRAGGEPPVPARAVYAEFNKLPFEERVVLLVQWARCFSTKEQDENVERPPELPQRPRKELKHDDQRSTAARDAEDRRSVIERRRMSSFSYSTALSRTSSSHQATSSAATSSVGTPPSQSSRMNAAIGETMRNSLIKHGQLFQETGERLPRGEAEGFDDTDQYGNPIINALPTDMNKAWSSAFAAMDSPHKLFAALLHTHPELRFLHTAIAPPNVKPSTAAVVPTAVVAAATANNNNGSASATDGTAAFDPDTADTPRGRLDRLLRQGGIEALQRELGEKPASLLEVVIDRDMAVFRAVRRMFRFDGSGGGKVEEGVKDERVQEGGNTASNGAGEEAEEAALNGSRGSVAEMELRDALNIVIEQIDVARDELLPHMLSGSSSTGKGRDGGKDQDGEIEGDGGKSNREDDHEEEHGKDDGGGGVLAKRKRQMTMRDLMINELVHNRTPRLGPLLVQVREGFQGDFDRALGHLINAVPVFLEGIKLTFPDLFPAASPHQVLLPVAVETHMGEISPDTTLGGKKRQVSKRASKGPLNRRQSTALAFDLMGGQDGWDDEERDDLHEGKGEDTYAKDMIAAVDIKKGLLNELLQPMTTTQSETCGAERSRIFALPGLWRRFLGNKGGAKIKKVPGDADCMTHSSLRRMIGHIYADRIKSCATAARENTEVPKMMEYTTDWLM